MKDIILFDMDGVIVDSFSDQYIWFKKIAGILKKDFSYSLEKFRDIYTEPVYPKLYDKLGLEWKKNLNIIWEEYQKHKRQSKIKLFKGIDEVIGQLSKNGKKLIIASSNTHETINKYLFEYKIGDYFQEIVGKEDLPLQNNEPKLKPNPDCLLIALDKAGCGSLETIYVGDQPSDIIAARRVAEYKNDPIPIIAVTYGYCSGEKLKKMKPYRIVNSPKELYLCLVDNKKTL